MVKSDSGSTRLFDRLGSASGMGINLAPLELSLRHLRNGHPNPHATVNFTRKDSEADLCRSTGRRHWEPHVSLICFDRFTGSVADAIGVSLRGAVSTYDSLRLMRCASRLRTFSAPSPRSWGEASSPWPLNPCPHNPPGRGLGHLSQLLHQATEVAPEGDHGVPPSLRPRKGSRT